MSAASITIAAAVPKGERADWMIEKLSELGCHRFIPLATERSVVLPEGKNKHDRWTRIAIESAKQSRRAGVMQIDPLTPLADAAHDDTPSLKLVLSTDTTAQLIIDALRASPNTLTLFIGPEGGWTDEELTLFSTKNIPGVKLTSTILRTETAAIAAAAIAAASLASIPKSAI
jgi:16S rRNA (uracil1498-N3)-methyltransferase